MAYSIFKFRNFTAAGRKRNLKRFGLWPMDRSLALIDDGPYGATAESPTSGEIDGLNNTFVFAAEVVSLFKNGIMLRPDVDYTLDDDNVTVTMHVAPETGASLWSIVG